MQIDRQRGYSKDVRFDASFGPRDKINNTLANSHLQRGVE
jgi:hypothetical protein